MEVDNWLSTVQDEWDPIWDAQKRQLDDAIEELEDRLHSLGVAQRRFEQLKMACRRREPERIITLHVLEEERVRSLSLVAAQLAEDRHLIQEVREHINQANASLA